MLNYSTCDFASIEICTNDSKNYHFLFISFSSPYYLSFIGHYAVLPNSLSLAPLTLCFALWPLATSSSLGILGTVDYSFDSFVMMLHSCFLSVNACSIPISISGIAQNPGVLSTHYWFWAAFPPAAICTYFFI